MTKAGLFFISDYRIVTSEPGRSPSYWILKELDKCDKFKVYSTANSVSDSSCFEGIEFITLNYKGEIITQRPSYNYRIYSAYMKVKDKVNIIHHSDFFQVDKGYNLIPVLSNIKDKAMIIGPIELPHKVFEDDFLVDSDGLERFIKKAAFFNKRSLGRIFKVLFKKTIELADKVVVPNEEVKKELSNYISSAKIAVINYGVDLSIYRKHEYEADENNYNIVYAGSALERKGVKYLLKAVNLIKSKFSVKLHLLSSGYKIQEYKRLSKELDITENVVFHGILEKQKYLDLLSRSRLLCLPTLSEGYGWTILDALCLGVPVVTTHECRCDELFENGDIGIRVEPENSEMLAQAITELFNDFGLCKKFSENGLKKRERFDYEKIIPQYIKLYENFV